MDSSPVSARVLEVIGTSLQGVTDAEVLENIISTACISWNMAIVKKLGHKHLYPHAGGSAEAMALIDGWSIRKERLFPDDTRLVLNCDVKYIKVGTGGMVKPDLVISSIPVEACLLPDGSVREGVPSGNVLRWQEV